MRLRRRTINCQTLGAALPPGDTTHDVQHTHALCDVASACVMFLSRLQPWARVAGAGVVGRAAWFLLCLVFGAFWLGFLFWVLPGLAFRLRLPFLAGEKGDGKGKPLRAALVRPAASAAGIAGYYC